jgi:hypothetical protein
MFVELLLEGRAGGDTNFHRQLILQTDGDTLIVYLNIGHTSLI